MSALLEVRQLRGGYGRAEVLRGIELAVGRGEIVALLGSNGAGKSTLNNTVCGIVPAWSGQVMLDGRDLTRAHYREIVQAGLIQVPEGRRIFPNLSVRENLELGSFARGRADRASNLERALNLFPRLRERTTQLAGTMPQTVLFRVDLPAPLLPSNATISPRPTARSMPRSTSARP